MSLPVRDADALLELQDILDQLNLGEMPPKKAKQPPEQELRQAIAVLTETVAGARSQISTAGGQTVLRRLNRREYLNTIRDLFALNMTMFDPTAKFPGDQLVMHMDNNGSALRTSGYLLDQYLDAANQVVEKAFRLQERHPSRPGHSAATFTSSQRSISGMDRSVSAISVFTKGPIRSSTTAPMCRSWSSLKACPPTDSMKSR